MELENNPIDLDKPLFVTVDSSRVATCYLLFQISEDGRVIMITTKSKIFDAATRNKPSVLKELLGLTYLLVQDEALLKEHNKGVLLLTDFSSLAYLQRNRFADNKLVRPSIVSIQQCYFA